VTDVDQQAPRLPFRDRVEAGDALGSALRARLAGQRVAVLGLPRGGVPVAAQVATALDAPLDVFVVRKLGAPGHPELAVGAIAGGGVRVLNHEVVSHLRVDDDALERVTQQERAELQRREHAYRGDRPPVDVAGRTAVIVDDGLATGATVLAAVAAVRALEPDRVVVAVPVGAPDACHRVAQVADDVVCLHAPRRFGAVGAFYRDFRQTTDDQVQRLLRQARDT
jgi:putative phosphoribosyl transferase